MFKNKNKELKIENENFTITDKERKEFATLTEEKLEAFKNQGWSEEKVKKFFASLQENNKKFFGIE